MPSSKFISIENLAPGMILDQPIKDRHGRTMIEKGIFLDSYQIDYIREKKYPGVYIYDMHDSLDGLPKKVVEAIKSTRVPDLPTFTITDTTRAQLGSSIRAIFDDTVSEGFVDLAGVTSNLIEKAIQSNDAVAVDINKIRASDEYTFKHSVDVGILSLMIGQSYGLKGEDLHQLGIAGLLHDIGKTKIPLSILNKPGKLTDEEFAIIKKHPVYGFDIVKSHNCFSPQILDGILHHHEKINGHGYPDGLCGDEISLFARIISVADIYDALITKRPYKNPYTGREAAEMIYALGDDLDNDLIHAFLRSVIIYPMDSIVRLSNNRAARVVRNYQLYPTRPKCVDILSGQVLDLCKDRRCMNLVISS